MTKLHQNLIVSIVVAVCGLSLFAIASADTRDVTRGGHLLIEQPTQGTRFSIAALNSDSTNEFTSAVINTDFPFNAVSFSWKQSADLNVKIQTRFQKETWTDWHDVALDEDVMSNSHLTSANPSTELVFTPYTNILQYKFIFANADDRSKISNLSVDYIDSTKGNRAIVQVASATDGLTVVSRAQWGADESLRMNSDGTEEWPREYYTPKRFIIHHTDSSDVSNPLATLRAIYYFHTKTHDWGDIGYNYLIDGNGTIYEGRYGGDAVVGAHAVMNNRGAIGIAVLGCFHPGDANCNGSNHLTMATELALEKFIAAKSQQFGIDPNGMSPTYDRGMAPNVIGHRDVGHTNCPGDNAYVELSSIRSTSAIEVAALPKLPSLALAAQLVAAPPKSVTVPSNATSDVIVKFKNIGEAVWHGYEDDHLMLGTDVKKLGMINEYRIAQLATPANGFKLVEGNVAPGETGTFKITVHPNDGTKTYTLAWSNRGYIENTDVTISAVAGAPVANGVAVQAITPIIKGSVVTQNFPETMLLSSTADVTVSVKNEGNIPWTKDKLTLSVNVETGAASPLIPNPTIHPKEDSVAPGQTATFAFSLQALDTYDVIRHLIVITYDRTQIATLGSQTMIVGEYSAQITSETIPATMKKNKILPVTIVIKNIGTKPWTGFQLKSTDAKGLQSAMYDKKTWMNSKIIATNKKTINPGDSATISVRYWSPLKTGQTTQLYKLWTGKNFKQAVILNSEEIMKRMTIITK